MLEGISALSGVIGLGGGKTRKRGITDYSLHKCEVIVNSLNIEGEFINCPRVVDLCRQLPEKVIRVIIFRRQE